MLNIKRLAFSAIISAFVVVVLFIILHQHARHSSIQKPVMNAFITASRRGYSPSFLMVNRTRFSAVNITIYSSDMTYSFTIDGICNVYLPVGRNESVLINVSNMSGPYRFYSDIYAGPGVSLNGTLLVVE